MGIPNSPVMAAATTAGAPAGETLGPPLKWAGGKRWLLPHLRPLWASHNHRRLVEPFAGGLAVTLGLRPERALVSDINPHAINFYRQLAKGLVAEVKMQNEADCYYRNRDAFNALIAAGAADTPEAAAYFYYLNRTGFNGLCRFNRRGAFNVPFGRYRSIRYTRDFTAYVPVFEGWELRAGDFETIALAPDDFVYADPPYDVEFTSYSAEAFGWPEQVRLAEWLARHPGPVVLSNQATPRVLALYGALGFELQQLPAPRTIACNGDRRPATEVVATRNL